jgi:F0F1-type ATP synthase membrane subunit b/b'|tara:strand:+ start:752 stop:853 length:102 start_codon:yes stop_codon:yes gene_type:complete
MPVPLRRFYAQKLIDAKKKESEIIENARKSAKK